MPEEETDNATQVDAAAETSQSTVEDIAEEVAGEIESAVEQLADETVAEDEAEVTADDDGDNDEETEDEDEPTGPASFESVEAAVAEVERLRKENASRRVKNKEVAEENAALNQFLEALADESTRDQALQVLAEATGQTVAQVEAATEAVTSNVITPETLDAKVSALFQQRESQLAEQRAADERALAIAAKQQEIFAKVKDLGYEPEAEAGTPEYAAHAALWGFVARQPEGQKDLAAANEAVKAFEQAIFDKRLQEMRDNNSAFPPVASGNGGGEDAQAPVEPKTARERAIWAEEEQIRRSEARRTGAPLS